MISGQTATHGKIIGPISLRQLISLDFKNIFKWQK